MTNSEEVGGPTMEEPRRGWALTEDSPRKAAPTQQQGPLTGWGSKVVLNWSDREVEVTRPQGGGTIALSRQERVSTVAVNPDAKNTGPNHQQRKCKGQVGPVAHLILVGVGESLMLRSTRWSGRECCSTFFLGRNQHQTEFRWLTGEGWRSSK